MFGWLRKSFDAFGRDSRWPTVRRRHLERYPTCAACGASDKIEVHHVIPVGHARRIGRSDLELDPLNLISLCGPPRDCHWWLGHACDDRKWRPDVRRLAQVILTSEVREQGDHV
jgi:5-methylcytosine-specific restriction endonuclease McrA